MNDVIVALCVIAIALAVSAAVITTVELRRGPRDTGRNQ